MAIKETLARLGLGDLWADIKPTIQLIASKAGRAALALAKRFVVEALKNPELAGGSGKARAAWVADQIRHESAKLTGNPVADRVINLAIEIAYAKYREANPDTSIKG